MRPPHQAPTWQRERGTDPLPRLRLWERFQPEARTRCTPHHAAHRRRHRPRDQISPHGLFPIRRFLPASPRFSDRRLVDAGRGVQRERVSDHLRPITLRPLRRPQRTRPHLHLELPVGRRRSSVYSRHRPRCLHGRPVRVGLRCDGPEAGPAARHRHRTRHHTRRIHRRQDPIRPRPEEVRRC